MKRLLGAGVVFATAGALSGGLALAAPPDKRGCPASFELTTVDAVLEIATPGFEDDIRAADVNEDELLCVKLLPEPIPLFEPTFLYYDNNRHP